MKNNIRNIRLLRNMSQKDLAHLVQVGVPQVSKWESGSVDIPSTRLAVVASALGVTVNDLLSDAYASFTVARPEQASPQPESNARIFKMEGASEQRMRDDLPVYGTALGAPREVEGDAIEQTTLNRAEVVQYARRPVILDGNAAAYGLWVSGSSMEPRHMDGEMLVVDPKGRIKGGEDVVVYLRPQNPEDDDGEAARAVLVKRLIRRSTAYVELEQFEPRKIFRIDMKDVVRIDRVIPWQELLT